VKDAFAHQYCIETMLAPSWITASLREPATISLGVRPQQRRTVWLKCEESGKPVW
jgi:hypothetical protein